MNEVNALVWPSPGGVGVLDLIGWNQTVQVAKGAKIIKQDPSTTAYDTSIVAEALTGIEGDTKGESFTKGTVPVTPAVTRVRSIRAAQTAGPARGRPSDSRAGPPSAAAWTLRPGPRAACAARGPAISRDTEAAR